VTETTDEAPPLTAAEDRQADPVMRSTLHRKHAVLGATFERRGAWSVPSAYQSADSELGALSAELGFADVSARGKVHLSGEVDGYIRSLTGAALDPLQTAPAASGGTVARPARDWALVLLAPSEEAGVIRTLERQPTSAAMATDVTGAYSGFLVAGPLLEAFLARTVNADLSGLVPGRCLATSWARIPAVLVSRDLPSPAVEIYVSSDQGRYAWEVLQRLAGIPVGWLALESWGWK
jgi:glycine cleavage system aminomethyltransferase T